MANLPASLRSANTFEMPSNFRAVYCAADGQLTPPDSPNDFQKPMLGHRPKLQLSRLLRRSKTDHESVPLPTRRSSPSRPFVSEMKAPFPLYLPASPSASDVSSDSCDCPTWTPRLRRRSPTYHDLRTLATQQKEVLSRGDRTPLLPSPIVKDNVQSDSYFTFRNPRRAGITEYKSYEDLHILSAYCDENQPSETQDRTKDLDDLDDGIWEDSPVAEGDDAGSTWYDEAPATPPEQIYRTSELYSDESPDEAGWLSNDLSWRERESRFKARCAGPCGSKIMLAEVAGSRKPKLVHISRSSSLATSRFHTHSPNITRPQTPVHAPLEVSKFSPYDTPDSPDRFLPLDVSPCAPRNTSPKRTAGEYRISTASLVPAPLALRTSHSSRSSSTIFSSTAERFAELSDPCDVSPRRNQPIKSDVNTSDWTIATGAWPVPPKSTLQRRPTPPFRQTTPDSIACLETRIRRLNQMITMTTNAINAFPGGIVRLDSPSIRAIRAPHIPDKTLIDPLVKIFPHAPILLLSALAAWLIIDIWSENAIITSPSCGRDAELTTEDVLQSQPAVDIWPAAYKISSPLPPSLAQVAPSPEVQAYLAYAWDATSPMRQIPNKARSLLGISDTAVLNEGLLKAHEAGLIRRLRVIRPSIGVIGQKLLVALRGSWDEDLWKCLKVMVEVIEESPAGLGFDV